MQSVKIKVCGIKSEKTARLCMDLGVDYLGFNFVPGSKREVSMKDAETIITTLHLKPIQLVALFYKTGIEKIFEVINSGLFGNIQYVTHDVGFQRVERPGLYYIPQIGINGEIQDSDISVTDNLCILDSYQKEKGGGSGETFPWKNVLHVKRKFLLAGGLTPENVSEAVEYLNPYGVDVASGVEDEWGNKNMEKIKRFVRNARR